MKRILCVFWLILFSALVFANEMPKSKRAKLEGNQIHFYDVGKGKNALVFIHGWTCNADFWKRSIREFPEYRVIAIDLPGHGQSDKPKLSYTMEHFAKSIEAVLKKAKVEKAVLIGHSMGTPVIRQFYRLFPEKTLGLVIVDGSLRTGTKAQMDEFISPLRTNYKENSVNFVNGMLQPIQDEKLKQEIRTAMLATPDYVGLSAMEGMIDEKIWTNDKINVPTLAILAKSDWWKADEKEFFKSIAADIDFQMWEGVSHFLMMEKPKEFNQTVKKFIADKKLL
jgi:pimeloyl-ACP methyl ester carboxylesterase